MHSFRRIAVYCGSSSAVDATHHEAAKAMGTELVQQGIGLVYGGGRVGLMGAVADAVMAAGGEVIGVIPDRLHDIEVGHHGLTELYVVDSMHARKAMMLHLSDGYIALPGGFGTWEEILEAATQGMLAYHDKPLGILNVDGYYDHFLKFIEHAEAVGFIRPNLAGLFQVDTEPSTLLGRMRRQVVPSVLGLKRGRK